MANVPRAAHQRELRNAIARQSFPAFVHWAFRIMYPGVELSGEWYVDAIAYRLQCMYDGKESPRLVINLPPRALKSFIASICLPAWLLGRNPCCQIICASYSEDLGSAFSRACRSLMEHPEYKRMFPATRLSSRKSTEREFETTRGGGRLTTSVSGTLTGRGADWIIIDDPIKAEDARSQSGRAAVLDWYQHTVRSRLNNQAEGRIVVVQQRLHPDDLSGELIRRNWPALVIRAIATETVEYPIGPNRCHTVREGELLDPRRLGRSVLASIAEEIGSQPFSAQYQQAPLPDQGIVLRREWFSTYPRAGDLPKFKRRIASVDTAAKTGDANDYTAITVWGVTDAAFYLLHATRGRWGVRDAENTIIRLAEEMSVDMVIVEDTSSGTALIELLNEHRGMNVTGWTPRGDKHARLGAQLGKFESNKIFLPDDAPWLAGLLEELLAFPAGTYDDYVDSVVQALEWATEHLRRSSIPLCVPGGTERESPWRMGSTIDFRKPFDENWLDRWRDR